MKRTSLWLVLLALTPGIGKAWGYGSYYCGVRYTPYAFTYRSSGLVSCGVDYTPYALTYRKSGLVPGYEGTCGSCVSYGYPLGAARPAGRPAARGSRPSRGHADAAPATERAPNGMDVIKQHLLARDIPSADINQILMIDNRLVSVDFLVADRNLLIKYWNPEAIETLNAQGGSKQKHYDNYRRNWAEVAAEHEKNGTQIYCVEASDAQAIVAALNSCATLNVRPEGETVLYAKE